MHHQLHSGLIAPAAATAVVLLSGALIGQQATWVRRDPPHVPTEAREPALATDVVHGTVVAFGGAPPISPLATGLDETWVWTGDDWHEVSPAHRPSGRSEAAMAPLADGSGLLLHGGRATVISPWLGDTWTWDGNDWTARPAAVLTTPLAEPRLATDAVRGETLLTGVAQGAFRAYRWQSGGWQELVASPHPPAATALVADVRRGVFLAMHATVQSPYLFDTWSWNGSQWLAHGSTGAAGPVMHQAAVALPGDDGPILVQQFLPVPIEHATLRWDGTSWHALDIVIGFHSPTGAVVALDPITDRALLLGGGGAERLWELRLRSDPAGVQAFAAGCSGSAGTPALGATGASRPLIGSTFEGVVSGLPPSRIAATWILFGGSDRVHHLGLALPLDLGAAGMPGCALAVSSEATFRLDNALGSARWSLAIPAEPALDGLDGYAQALVLDPAANPLGMTLSNAARLRFGFL